MGRASRSITDGSLTALPGGSTARAGLLQLTAIAKKIAIKAFTTRGFAILVWYAGTLAQFYYLLVRSVEMISSNDFRTGTTIELDGAVWRVVEFLHVKPGKGSAFVRTKLKGVQSGNVVEKTFRAGEMVPQAILEKSVLQHTYMESGDYVFMDMSSYEETRLTAKQIGESRKYLKEGMEVNVVSWNDKPLEVELPNSVVLEVKETDPGIKGDTATGGTKPAILETGAQVMVPLFITVGEKIKVDTRNDSYLGRES